MKVTPIRAPAQDPAINTLKLFHGDRFWQIVAIRREPHDIVAASFTADSAGEDAARAFGSKWNDLGYNIYFPINPLKRKMGSKAARADVLEARWVWAEIDPPSDLGGLTLEAWRAAALADIKRGREGVPPHTMIVDSGRGFWAFWRLRSPVALNGGEGPAVDAVESRVRGLGLAFGGDSLVYDTCRIARLPGFVNHKTKIVARVIEQFSDRDCDLEQFPAAATRDRTVCAPGASIEACYVNDAAAVEAASEYLLSDLAPLAVEGFRHKYAFTVLQRCLDFGCSLDRGKDLAQELWSPRCPSPPSDSTWDKMRSLPRQSLIGCDHPQARIDGWIEKPYVVKPPAGAPGPAAEVPAFDSVEADSFEGVPVPIQKWLVEGLIPAGVVTLLSGDGGVGKSLLTLQLGAAAASGTQWLGFDVPKSCVLFLTAEDEIEECQRRVNAICLHSIDIEFKDLAGLSIVSLDGEDAVIAAPAKDGQMHPTILYARLKATVRKRKSEVLILDTLADLFGGDEVKRSHTRQFIGLLRQLCREFGVTIVLLSHPSLSGMASGSGLSGSTAWNNSVRSRLYLDSRKDRNGEELDPDIRVLKTMKANRGKRGDETTLRYRNGVFLRETAASAEAVASRESKADETFLKLLDSANAEGREVTHSLRSQNYAPRRFETSTQAGGLVKKDFEEAMERLFSSKQIAVAEYGPPSNRHSKIVKSDLVTQNKSLFD